LIEERHSLGIGLGAFAWGLISQGPGYSAISIGCIACMVVAVVVYLLVLGNKQRSAK
jgi:predicted MFS family arabinose efflux permease